MKKWVFGCAMALVITSCDNKKFSIQGRVADADGQVLYLESLAVNGTELLDSVELVMTVGLNSSIMLRSILSFIN